jgi:hypothetical protein
MALVLGWEEMLNEETKGLKKENSLDNQQTEEMF